MPSVQKYMLIENCPMYRSTGLRPAAPVRYQTSGERQRNQSRYSSVETTGDMVPSDSVRRSPMTSASLYGSVSVWQSRCAVMLLRQP